MGFFFAMLLILGFVALLAWSVHFTRKQEKKRREIFSAFAQENDYQFTAEHDPSILQQYQHFSLFQGGRHKKATNSLKRTLEDSFIHAFHYSVTNGSGKNSHTYIHTCIHITGQQSAFPHFLLRHESAFLDSLGKIFGGQDINFPSDAVFSDSFVLQGNDADKTRYFFSSQQIRNAFMIYKGTGASIEGNGDSLLISYWQLVPEKFPLEMENALLLHNSIQPNA